MRNAAWIPILVALSVAAVLMFSSDSGREPSDGAEPRRGAAIDIASEPAQLADGGGSPQDTALAGVPSERSVRDALDASAGEVEGGGGAGLIVSGHVVDDRGNALAGARVLAAPRYGSATAALDSARNGRRKDLLIAVADEAGRFELNVQSAGAYQWAIRANGCTPWSDNVVQIPNGARHDMGAIQLSRACSLSGFVVDTLGRAIVGAEVFEVDAFDSIHAAPAVEDLRLLARTDDAGKFRINELAPGPWGLLVRAQDHLDEHVRGISELGTEPRPLELILTRGATIAGLVRGLAGTAGRAVAVRAEVWSDNGEPAGGVRSADVDAQGRFEIGGLEEGRRYALRAYLTGSDREDVSEPVSESKRVLAGERGVVLTAVQPAAVLFVVRDADSGASIPNVEVGVSVGGAGDDAQWVARDVSDGLDFDANSGAYRLGGLTGISGAVATSLEIRASGYAPRSLSEVSLDPGEELQLGVLSLTALPTIDVRVLDGATRRPLAGARVSAALPGANGGEARVEWSTTDKSGAARLPADERVGAAVWATFPGYAPTKSRDAQAGQPSEVELLMTKGGRVRVAVRDADGNPSGGVGVLRGAASRAANGAELPWSATGIMRSGVTNAEGVVEFPFLRPGLHRFAVTVTGGTEQLVGPWSDVDVGDRAIHDVQLEEPGRFGVYGTVKSAGRNVVGALVWLAAGGERSLADRRRGRIGTEPLARTDSEGNYRIDGLEPGTYVMVVAHPERAMSHEEHLSFEDSGRYRYDIDLKSSRVSGTVVDADGRSVVGASVAVFRKAEAIDLSSEMRANSGVETDTFGGFDLAGVETGTPLVVVAHQPGYQLGLSAELKVGVDAAVEDVEIVLHKGGRLAVSVTRGGSIAALDVPVTAKFRGLLRNQIGARHARTDLEGVARFEGLAFGNWIVQVSPGDEVYEVEVQPGIDSRLTVELENAE